MWGRFVTIEWPGRRSACRRERGRNARRTGRRQLHTHTDTRCKHCQHPPTILSAEHHRSCRRTFACYATPHAAPAVPSCCACLSPVARACLEATRALPARRGRCCRCAQPWDVLHHGCAPPESSPSRHPRSRLPRPAHTPGPGLGACSLCGMVESNFATLALYPVTRKKRKQKDRILRYLRKALCACDSGTTIDSRGTVGRVGRAQGQESPRRREAERFARPRDTTCGVQMRVAARSCPSCPRGQCAAPGFKFSRSQGAARGYG